MSIRVNNDSQWSVNVLLHVFFFFFLTGTSLLFLMSITLLELKHLEFFEPLELFQQLKVRTGQGCNVDYVAEYSKRQVSHNPILSSKLSIDSHLIYNSTSSLVILSISVSKYQFSLPVSSHFYIMLFLRIWLYTMRHKIHALVALISTLFLQV